MRLNKRLAKSPEPHYIKRYLNTVPFRKKEGGVGDISPLRAGFKFQQPPKS
jgi:hypothetical protein